MKTASKHWNALPKPVVVTVLGGAAAGKRHIPATLLESNGRELKLQFEVELAPETAIKIEVDGGLVLGAVAWLKHSGSAVLTTVEIDQVIPDAAGLAHLVSAVLGQQPPAARPYSPTDRQQVESPVARPGLRPSPR